jgi:hypothetical protein
MDKFDINDLVRRYEWAAPAIFLLLGLLFTVLFYQLFTMPKFSDLKKCRQLVSIESDRLSQYRDIKSFTSKLGEQKLKINALLANPDVNPATVSDTLEGISAIATSAGLKLDNVLSETGVAGQSWSISFDADSRQLVNFIAILERNYRIKTILAAGSKEMPRISMNITSVRPGDTTNGNARMPIDTSGELYDLAQKATNSLSEIERLPAGRPVIPVTRDLFSDKLIDPAVTVKKEEPKRPKVPYFKLSSISWDPETPVAVIEDMVLKEGDVYRGIYVVRINKKSVDIKWRSIDATLKLNN